MHTSNPPESREHTDKCQDSAAECALPRRKLDPQVSVLGALSATPVALGGLYMISRLSALPGRRQSDLPSWLDPLRGPPADHPIKSSAAIQVTFARLPAKCVKLPQTPNRVCVANAGKHTEIICAALRLVRKAN